MKKPKKKPVPCTCSQCQCGMQFPQVLRVLITSVEEPQVWRISPKGNFIPIFVEDEPIK